MSQRAAGASVRGLEAAPADGALRQGEALLALLETRGLLGSDAAARALLVHNETGERAESVVTRLGLLSEQNLARFFAEETGLPILPASQFPDEFVRLDEISVRFLRDRRVLPIDAGERGLRVAFGNPIDCQTRAAMRYATGREIQCHVALPSDIDMALDRVYGPEGAGESADAALDDEDLERLKDLASDAPAIRAVNRLIIRAGELHASDIHLEPSEENLGVRFRIDGLLRAMQPLPASMKQALVSRIKIMAGLDIAERRLPQDGRLRLAVRGQDVDLRIATSPTIHGESVVMRLLDRSNLSLDFATLGFSDGQAAALLQQVGKPHGIVLVTGPTGSGKTTTLYSAISVIRSPERKVLTIEDPIEYRMPGISQTQVQPAIGLDFARALRSFLRQDPDIVMVGEIRDLETAQVAVQAALTGHLILSTLHTNSAAAAVTRLVDMGVEPFLISSCLNAVLAQRLVRRLCDQCSVPTEPSAAILAGAGIEAAAADGLDFREPAGCEACNHRGYRGRLAIVELLPMTPVIGALIAGRAEERDIEAAATAAGMKTLLRDGLDKASRGLTTVEEVLRVTQEA